MLIALITSVWDKQSREFGFNKGSLATWQTVTSGYRVAYETQNTAFSSFPISLRIVQPNSKSLNPN